MDFNNFTIPPELFYSKSPSETKKPRCLSKIEPKDITKAIKPETKENKRVLTKTQTIKKRLKRRVPELGRIQKIKRALIKKKVLKKSGTGLKTSGTGLKEKSENVILHPNVISDHNLNNNNSLLVKLTKQDERAMLKEIRQKEDEIKKRLFGSESLPKKRFRGSNFKFFKSKNVHEDKQEAPDDTEELVPEIRDYSTEKVAQQPETNKIIIEETFEDDGDTELDATTVVIESLLQNLEEPVTDEAAGSSINNGSLDELIMTLEGKHEDNKTSPTITKQKQKFLGLGENQLQIDAGQKKFGFVECKECGFSYNTNVPEDEKIHNKHHEAVKLIPRFRGWATEDALTITDWSEWNGRVIHLQPNNKNIESQYVAEIISKMELEFGVQDNYKKLHVYLVAYDMKVVGIATVVDSIKAQKDGDEKEVRVGIKRLFVRQEFRRKGFARALLKTIAMMHHKGELMKLRDDFAFSQPTEDGKKLIENVVGTSSVFVFNS